ncbi:unnamed protein product, partial [Rotaria sp. Silwood2]
MKILYLLQSGTNTLIFAYDLIDSDMCQPNGDIYYHKTRRGIHVIPLRSYANPPSEDMFVELDSFDFRLDN